MRPRFGGASLVIGFFYRVFYRVEVGRRKKRMTTRAAGCAFDNPTSEMRARWGDECLLASSGELLGRVAAA